MINSNKTVAVIGEPTIVKIFQAVGYACFYETEPEDVIARCQALDTAGYQIILILEKTARQINQYLDSRAGIPYPIIVPIPDTVTSESYGMQRLNTNLEKVIGMKVKGDL